MSKAMKTPGPILVADLFPEVRRHLLSLLESLTTEDWLKPTAAGKWNVKDVALHLLGGAVGNLSRRRDAWTPPGPDLSRWEDLVAFINRLNESWVAAGQRISSRLLCDLLAHVGAQVDAYFASLDPFAVGGPVSWAGSQPAPVWLDVAREYTEQWHHQQQIRDATGRAGLYEPRLFAPVLDAFVRALPHTFRNVDAAPGTAVQLTLEGPGGGDWVLRRTTDAWELLVGQSPNAASEVILASQDAWKIFARGIRGEAAAQRTKIKGDSSLAGKVLETVSVIA
jgi:uncharacterized protein (TIGR03083 family)